MFLERSAWTVSVSDVNHFNSSKIEVGEIATLGMSVPAIHLETREIATVKSTG